MRAPEQPVHAANRSLCRLGEHAAQLDCHGMHGSDLSYICSHPQPGLKHLGCVEAELYRIKGRFETSCTVDTGHFNGSPL